MKYFIDFLAELKKGNISPVYLLYGPESYLRDQAIELLKKYVLPPGGEQINYDVLDGSTMSGLEIVTIATSTSFLAGRRLVLVRSPQIFETKAEKNEQDIKHILGYLASPYAGTCLVFETAQNVDKRKKIYKEIARVGRTIEFTLLKPADLTKWLAKRAREEGCNIGREAVGELLARCGRDMYTLYHEMEKLVSYTGPGKTISLETVRQMVAARLEDSIFEVVDAIGGKNYVRALSGIRNLLMHKQQPQQIIGMVARQFRLILQVQGLAQKGMSREQIIAALKLHPFVYTKIYAQRKNFPAGQLVKALNHLTELDYALKTGRADFYPAIETFILKICI
ncbi:DNA polymerase III subunit delta [Sporotomaculum syntrophicum]|uniref:DNA polymerase III subunit delta n=1 Tax=Sporotomaculum syntrophicum TaxID=182264 RepID=A0A9D3AXU7_9FIRM|nr:DNA polymerase III subunit delta [Sporotomaculum syntrophicum]KAF1084104.1 DNA polymerase III subunit delta [Sporotomaculum syntrophicum]